MQRLSAPVLQTLQRPRAFEEEGGRGRSKTVEERERQTGRDTRPETRQASISLASDSSHASSQSASSSLERETPRYSRLSRSEVSSGRRGGAVGGLVPSQGSFEDEEQKRQAHGPRALGASSWETTAETIPSQHLGRRAEGDAYFLTSDSNYLATPSLGRKPSEHDLSNAPKQMQGYLTPLWISRHDTEPSLPKSDKKEPSPPKTPGSNNSSSSQTQSSKSSAKSYASSFAYLLRDNRNDMRLLKRKSRPSQHLHKSPASIKKPPEPRRSSSYYKPKVVEDSAALLAPASPELSPRLKPPKVTASPPLSPVRKARSSPSQSGSESTPLLTTPAPSPRRQIVPIYSPDHDFNQAVYPLQRPRIDSPSRSDSRNRDSSQPRHGMSLNRRHGPSSLGLGPSDKAWYYSPSYPATPPEEEPRIPFDSTNMHGDHYFRTFGTDTIYQKEVAPKVSHDPMLPVNDNETPALSPATMPSATSSPSPMSPAEQTRIPSSRKRSSIFGIFRHGEGTHHLFHGSRGKHDLPTSPMPDITVSTPQLGRSRRRSSFMGSYFSHIRRAKASSSSQASPSPTPSVSGLSTNWEDVAAESQPINHVKEISEPTSPLSVPQPRRPGPSPIQDKKPEMTRQLPEESIVSVVPSGPAAGPQPKYKSASGEEFYKVNLTGPNAMNYLPSEMKRLDTPPEDKKPRGFKSFFFDMRSLPTEPTTDEADSPEPRATKRRGPIFARRSLQSLVSKLSIPKLRKRSSQLAESAEEPEDPLAVAGFQQTPYSQRYGDARRAKMSQIRSYMEEALKEDDDDDSGTFPFDLNVPDHLPNSPLCPLSSKHKSGGKAICPLHRRKRTSIMPPPKKSPTLRRQEPRIVFESGPGGDGVDSPRAEELRRRLSEDS